MKKLKLSDVDSLWGQSKCFNLSGIWTCLLLFNQGRKEKLWLGHGECLNLSSIWTHLIWTYQAFLCVWLTCFHRHSWLLSHPVDWNHTPTSQHHFCSRLPWWSHLRIMLKNVLHSRLWFGYEASLVWPPERRRNKNMKYNWPKRYYACHLTFFLYSEASRCSTSFWRRVQEMVSSRSLICAKMTCFQSKLPWCLTVLQEPNILVPGMPHR